MFVLWITLFACKDIEPAPQEIDALSVYFWQKFADEEPATLQEGLKSLHKAADADIFTEIIDGSVSLLEKEDLALVGKEDEDPSLLAGIFFLNKVVCPLSDVEKQVYATNQDELHPGFYDDYDRQYTSSLTDYKSRKEEFLSWDTTYEISHILLGSYTANIASEMRYVAAEEETDHANMFITRSVLQQPAYTDDEEELGFFQDYQLEVWYQLSDAETFHFYVMWREAYFTKEIGFDNETYQRIVLNNLPDWDEDIEDSCN